jgi:hypothetical protein
MKAICFLYQRKIIFKIDMIMKNKTILAAVLFATTLISCSGSEEKKAEATVTEPAADAGPASSTGDKTGNFSFDGKSVSGKIETQYFGDKEKANFSVLCQHNESSDPANANFELLQVTFVNEKDATNNPALKIYSNGSSLPMTEPEPGIVAVSLTGVGNGLGSGEFTGSEKSTGTITVKNRTIEIKDLSLFTKEGDKKVITASLPF